MTERLTRSTVTDVDVPGAGTVALVTFTGPDAGPATLGPAGLEEMRRTLLHVQQRAAAGEVVAVAVTGTGRTFLAGADLRVLRGITDMATGLEVASLGHRAMRLLGEMDVPTVALVNGTALGGGLEVALHCDLRVAAEDVRALGLPETSLGLVPGWGGCTLLPPLVGVERSLELVVDRPLTPGGARPLDATAALDIGIVDAVLPAEDFLTHALRWVGEVVTGATTVSRPTVAPPSPDERRALSEQAMAKATALGHAARPAVPRAIDLVLSSTVRTRDESFAAEDQALAELILTDEVRAALYAFDLSTRGARQSTGDIDLAEARVVSSVGIVGAGLMAAQLGVLAATRLQVPVTLRDIDPQRVTAGLESVDGLLASARRAGRLSADGVLTTRSLIDASTQLESLSGADLVIEAVTEDLAVKHRVFAELQSVVARTAVLATNTSALSVTALAEPLDDPSRVVGMHFFNPVARLPLVEVVRTRYTSDAALATALATVRALGKTPVPVGDRPGFVVNRLLILLLADVLAAVEHGTPVAEADSALRPLGLPMSPFALLQLVGTGVALHVLQELHDGLGPRYRLSPGLERLAAAGAPLVAGGRDGGVDPAVQGAFAAVPGTGPSAGAVLDGVLESLTREVGMLLDEEVVSSPEQIDLCMILGAGWPGHLGGLTPYLDRTGWSERVLGRRLHAPGVASLA